MAAFLCRQQCRHLHTELLNLIQMMFSNGGCAEMRSPGGLRAKLNFLSARIASYSFEITYRHHEFCFALSLGGR